MNFVEQHLAPFSGHVAFWAAFISAFRTSSFPLLLWLENGFKFEIPSSSSQKFDWTHLNSKIKESLWLLPDPSDSSKMFWTCSNFFNCVQYSLNVVNYFGLCSNMQVFEVGVVHKILEFLKVLKVSVVSENQEVVKVGFFRMY